MKKLLLSLVLVFSFTACNSSAPLEPQDYVPTTDYRCDFILDVLTGQQIYACFWYYYSEGSEVRELDLAADLADTDSLVLKRNAEAYAEKYSLSMEQATKVAKNIQDLNSLSDRTMEDIADFAQKLYGVNPNEVISAISDAQIGNHSQMDELINKAAKKFNTSNKNMKLIIKDLHKKVLQSSGISL